MEKLSKSQIVALLILVTIVTSVTTAVSAVTLREGDSRLAQTVQEIIDQPSTNDDAEPDTRNVTIISSDERIVEIVKNFSPAVVSIVATKDVPRLRQCAQGFFGFGICQDGTERREVSSGSGFFVTSSGLIATNRHVVSDTAASYSVLLNDGRTLDAEVIARDPFQDIALLKVAGSNHPALVLGDSDAAEIGRTVVAIGNALGEFQNTVSVGVVSGLSRTITATGQGGAEELRSLIQTDAAINPGNSGGPLIGLDGRVIGINTAVAAGAQSIGFALPVNFLRKDINDIERHGRIVYPYVGIRYVIITKALADERNLAVDYGALIQGNGSQPGVIPDSPAARAGLTEGDIILEINGERLTREFPLAAAVQKRSVGEEITLRVRKTSGDNQDMKLTLAEYKP